MAQPGIELRWADDMDRDMRARYKPGIVAAIDMVHDGIAHFGIPMTDRKRLVVHAVSPDARTYGMATGQKTMHAYLRPRDRYRGRVLPGQFATTLFHEHVHHERAKLQPDENLAEFAASEGVSYRSDYEFYRFVDPVRSMAPRILDAVVSYPDERAAKLRVGFDEHALDNEYWMMNDISIWVKYVRGLHVRRAEVIGIREADQRIAAGASVATLLGASAPEVLGLAV